MSHGGAHLGNHVIDEAVLVPDAQLLKLLLVALRLVDLLEDLQEAPVVALQNGVLRAARHMERDCQRSAATPTQRGGDLVRHFSQRRHSTGEALEVKSQRPLSLAHTITPDKVYLLSSSTATAASCC